MVAEAFEKIRINPGNFADGRKSFEVINYDDPAQFRAEQEHIREVSCYQSCSRIELRQKQVARPLYCPLKRKPWRARLPSSHRMAAAGPPYSLIKNPVVYEQSYLRTVLTKDLNISAMPSRPTRLRPCAAADLHLSDGDVQSAWRSLAHSVRDVA